MKKLRVQYADVTDRLIAAGLRPTRQRLLLGNLLFSGEPRHVTAECLYKETKAADIPVSLATIYNTLHQFTEAGLLREVCVEGGRFYFDTNTDPHHHFLCAETGELIDIASGNIAFAMLPNPPEGRQISDIEVFIRLMP